MLVVAEITSVLAKAVYALFIWVVVRVIRVAMDRPTARTVTRSVHEQTAGVRMRATSYPKSVAGTGTERTTHTMPSG